MLTSSCDLTWLMLVLEVIISVFPDILVMKRREAEGIDKERRTKKIPESLAFKKSPAPAHQLTQTHTCKHMR